MNKRKCLEQVNRLFEQRRADDRLEAGRRRAEIAEKVPIAAEKERELQRVYGEFFRVIADGTGSEAQLEAFRDRTLSLQARITDCIVSAGYPADYLQPVYVCPKCCDEGVIDGELCDCYKTELSREYLRESGLESLFDGSMLADFDFSLYAEGDGSPASPRAKMRTLVGFLRRWADGFDTDPKNLLFFGDPGCGKTFLSVCLGGEMIRRGKFVVYAPVQQLISDFEAEQFRNREAQLPTSDYLDADLLIIDDLGTEFYSYFVETTLYNVINTRLTRKKPIIISTNLDEAQRAEVYADRLNSRLLYSFLNVAFPSCDLRRSLLERKKSGRGTRAGPNS